MQKHIPTQRGAALIRLDGATGEGGGQILRTGLALSVITGRPLQIERIRAGRPKPGLMRQHLTCVQAAQAISGATVSGAELGSQQLSFHPGPVRAGDYDFAVGTAGSCTLVLQTVLPPLMLAEGPSRLQLHGGTHNPMAPPFHFLDRCFAPLVRRTGVGLTMSLRRHGFYPAGGGEIEAVIHPAAEGPQPFDLLERGAAQDAFAEVVAPALPRSVSLRELDALGRALGWEAGQLRELPCRQNEGPGNALMVTLVHEHATELLMRLGERGLSAEAVAAAMVQDVRAAQASDGAVGEHLADQWALPLALAVVNTGRPARYSFGTMTDHTRTNFGVIEQVLAVRFDVVRTTTRFEVTVRPASAEAAEGAESAETPESNRTVVNATR
ncbi:RNA 3'-terminal phosphate cyclase [Roseateles amylovorans]|uniref:RNA 3'-terminal phosphate cyclase n=1 Tax=Roseateles amylovorans TaxID=2978473 RepID=A0ABY6B1C7_9BURK|nr:RNA 3'-terminal phosphate cyclase [Roseateles amylovorans]UXH79197.1 RNA 3'-terminal phosphate cyclase [Roseateles amylovorans]